MLATLQPSGISPELSEWEQHMIELFQFLPSFLLSLFENYTAYMNLQYKLYQILYRNHDLYFIYVSNLNEDDYYHTNI